MKEKDIQELKRKSPEELRRLLHESTDELQKLRFSVEGGKVKNIHALKSLKRDVARIKTFLRLFELNAPPNEEKVMNRRSEA